MFNFVPRAWQKNFYKEWENRDSARPFLLIAIPGGGKTLAALDVCRQWRNRGSDRRIMIVVPTDNLREQWRDEASRMGLDLQTKDFGTNFKDGFQGGVTTYHTVAGNSLLFKMLCHSAPTMVVFDEIHHCGDSAHFGIGIKEAFSGAKEKLLMSGTPWKTDGSEIPFVRYDGGGFPVGDFIYDYPHAISDNVVRWLTFEHAKGSIRNEYTGETLILSKDISDEEAQQRLRKVLDPDGNYVRGQIILAHRKLMKCRETVPDAAAMAACINQEHAIRIAQVIREVAGCEPSVIVSDSELENDNVKRFRSSRTEWLVSVKKVSEGTDIKRLQVLCYLTNVTSELFFRQLIGRVSRVRNIGDDEAYVYLPSDPRLIECANNIENAQIQALKEECERNIRELEQRDRKPIEEEMFSTEHEGSEVAIIGNENVPMELFHKVEAFAERYNVSLQKALSMFRDIKAMAVAPAVEKPAITQPLGKEERMDAARRKINRAVGRLAKIRGCEYRDIHMLFKRQGDMTEDELNEKLLTISRWIAQEAK